MTAHIELIFDADCPNSDAARTVLRQACEQAGIEPQWQEWDRAHADSPPHTANYGSPTILVDGVDVAGADTASDAKACRIYHTAAGGLAGVPEAADIARLLRCPSPGPSTQLGAVAAVFAAGGTFLPVLTCPLCWPAYAGLLSALGLGFFDYTPFLAPVTGVLLALALTSLALGSRRRRDTRPLLVGVVAAGLLVAGLVVDSQWLTYLGAALLVGASFWNTRPGDPSIHQLSCKACEEDRLSRTA